MFCIFYMSARKAISSQMRRRGAGSQNPSPGVSTNRRNPVEQPATALPEQQEEILEAPVVPYPDVTYQDILRLPKPKNPPEMILQHNKRLGFIQKTTFESLSVINGNIDVLMQGHNAISDSLEALAKNENSVDVLRADVEKIKADIVHLKDALEAITMKLNEQDQCLSPHSSVPTSSPVFEGSSDQLVAEK